ncbi:unnamed protein product [Mytilus coruscus]|uniref:Uncharacterized protein n=1 Tax=Mytilus coruscus TaxID=42192 RepID=A0A6J8EIW5_MYTCO|nr:unnamed protein product [Mytilus coruscus]
MALALGGKKKSHKKKVINYDTPRQVQQSQRWEQKESHQDKPPFQSRPPSHSQGARNSGGRGNSRGNGFHRGNERGGIRYVKFCFKSLSHKKYRQNKQYLISLESLNLVTLSKHIPIAGRLKHFVKNWEIISSDKKILKDIQNVEVNFQSRPIQLKDPRMTVRNQKEKHLMSTEVIEMLTKEVIVPVKPCRDQFLSNWFLVSKKDECQRPVLNLKQLNQHVM